MKGLYLRTVFWLNLTAGGSVGHTSGVINAFRKQIELDVISNDDLLGVKDTITIIKPNSFLSLKILPIFIKELLYNFILCFKMKKKVKYDFIYQRYSGFSFVGAYLSKKNNVPFILEFNSSDVWKMKNWKEVHKYSFIAFLKQIYNNIFKLPIIKKLEAYNLSSADTIVVVSEALQEVLLSRGILSQMILVNPNGVDIEKFNPYISGENIKEKYCLTEKKIVGFIGTFGQWHGVMEMIEAICLFHKDHPELSAKVHFLLIGEGVLFDEAKNKITAASLNEKVTFTGLISQEKAPEYLAACDIFLSPHIKNPDGTNFFGSPTKLFEYMAMGKGIIASNLDQLGQILKDRKTAILVEAGDTKQLSEGIKFLLENEDVCNKLGTNAFNEVSANFTWDKHVEKIIFTQR